MIELQDLSDRSISWKGFSSVHDIACRVLELLMLHSSQCVEDGTEQEEDSRHNQRRCHQNERAPLDDGHSQVEDGSWPILVESFDKGIEIIGHWTDLEEKWDLDKEKNQPLYSITVLELSSQARVIAQDTYIAMIPNTITALT